MRKKEIKDKVTSIRLTSLQLARIRKMAEIKQWSLSKMISYLIDSVCVRLFVEGSADFKE